MAAAKFTSIPVIDLSKANAPATKAELLDDLRHALTNIGFLYVSRHSVSDDVIDGLIDALPQLFTLPENEKRKVALGNSPHFLGYSGTGSETTAGKVDKREQYEFATELEDEWREDQPLAERLKGPNQVKTRVCILSNLPANRSSGQKRTQSYVQSWRSTFLSSPSSARISCVL
jgi:isopenicillin N synthase-like dioxygenase